MAKVEITGDHCVGKVSTDAAAATRSHLDRPPPVEEERFMPCAVRTLHGYNATLLVM